MFDEEEFNSEAVQRVWQYLRRCKDPRLIQEFYFDAQRTEGNQKECLKTLIRFVSLCTIPSSRTDLHFIVRSLNLFATTIAVCLNDPLSKLNATAVNKCCHENIGHYYHDAWCHNKMPFIL